MKSQTRERCYARRTAVVDVPAQQDGVNEQDVSYVIPLLSPLRTTRLSHVCQVEYKFIQNHFHPKRENFVRNRFRPMTAFVQKPVSS